MGGGATDKFRRRWMLVVTIGEAAGFAIPAATGGLLALQGAPGMVVYPSMIVAGTCEGVLLGLAQSVAFGSSFVPRSEWIRATAVGAAIAWAIGMLPSTLGGMDFSAPLAIPLIVLLGSILLLSIPALQWLVLRRSGYRAASWIPVNASAWAAGILWTLAPSPFIDERTPSLILFGVFLLSGLLMAATVAALTAPTVHRLLSASRMNPARS